MASIRDVDDNLNTLLAAIDRQGLSGLFDVFITSDHGFSTIDACLDLTGEFLSAGLKASRDSLDVVLAGTAIYVPDGDRVHVNETVKLLQRLPALGRSCARCAGQA